jgi:hypothetical protein
MIIKFLQSPNVEQEQVGPRLRSTDLRLNSAAGAQFIDAAPTPDSSHIVAAYLNERDYRLARITMPEMGAFEDYEDWLDFRTGMLWGLEAAGYALEPIPVDLTEFAIWCRTISIPPSISALDRFARSRGLPDVDGQDEQDVVQEPT